MRIQFATVISIIRRHGQKAISDTLRLGCRDSFDASENRIIIFTNAMVYFGFLFGLSVYTQLDRLGVDPRWTPIYYMVIPPLITAPLLHYQQRIFLARVVAMLGAIAVGWTAALIFGKSFNGFYIFFLVLIYSIIAFSKYSLRMRIPMVLLAYASLPMIDYYSYYGMIPVTGFHSSDFPLHLLLTDTVLMPTLIGIMIWIEKSMANNHEKLLERAVRTIQNQKQKIQSILDHIELGILMVDHTAQIDRDFSAYTQTLLPDRDPANTKITSFLFHGSELSCEQRAIQKTVIDTVLGEDELNWELNKDHLVKSLKIRDKGLSRDIKLSWSPVIDGSIVDKLIVSLHDVTEENQMRDQLDKQSQLEAHFTSLIQAIDKVGLHNTVDLLRRVQALYRWPEEGCRHDLLRKLHGLKGEARTCGMTELSNTIHNSESLLLEDKQTPVIKLLEQSGFLELSNQLTEIQAILFRSNDEDATWDLSTLLSQIKKKTEDTQSVVWKRLLIDDQICQWPLDWKQDIATILSHAVQNSIDHGYLAADLDRAVEISIVAERCDKGVQISIRDQGQGLDLKALEAQYQKLPEELKTQVGAIENVVFLDHVSTAASTSLTSGRGIGMAAIKSLIEGRGGRVTIGNCHGGSGSLLTLFLPTATGEKRLTA
jgi:anti-sigma regulatory factor (Ser/Thr protein kinase)